MNLLAVETSSNACSVALGVGGEIYAEHLVEPRAHTRELMPMIARLLDRAALGPTDLDAVALGNGPGSFIGMRIGASVVQGMCFAAGVDVIPVSSLAVVAAEAMTQSDARRVVVTQDARMHEVYVGVFDRSESGLPIAGDAEVIQSVATADVGDKPFHAAGDGWNRYPELLQNSGSHLQGQLSVTYPDARFLVALAFENPAAAVPPAQLIPAYLRHKVAEKPVKLA